MNGKKRAVAGLAVGLVFAASASHAGVYKCMQGGHTVYTDTPCPSAKVVDTTNGRAPTASDRMLAQARKLRDESKVLQIEYDAEMDKRKRAECTRRQRSHAQAVADANKHKDDPWWTTRALNSGDRLNEDCGKYLVPVGAGYRD